MGYKIDITGKKYGKLTVIRYFDTVKRQSRWLCECECGKETVVAANHLKNGHTRSCGCLEEATRRKKALHMTQFAKIANTTHNGSKERLYHVWTSMKSRCYNANNPAFKWYGKFGIEICDEWKDYDRFRKWAYENGYDETAKAHDCSIDRIDYKKGYSPDNCRFVDAKVQSNNRSSNKLFTYNGQTKNIKQWANEYGCGYTMLRNRLIKNGWDIEKALTTPSRIKKRRCAEVGNSRAGT